MPSWLTIILALGGTALINGVVAFVLSRTLYKKAEKRDRDSEELEELREQRRREERKQDLKLMLNPIEVKIDNIDSKLEKVENGTLSSLRNDILTCYYRCKEKGYRNDYDYQNIHHLYEAYDELHGNSFIADIMSRFDKLPVKEDTVPTKVIQRKTKKEVLLENKCGKEK